jgi:hypothetical protein
MLPVEVCDKVGERNLVVGPSHYRGLGRSLRLPRTADTLSLVANHSSLIAPFLIARTGNRKWANSLKTNDRVLF